MKGQELMAGEKQNFKSDTVDFTAEIKADCIVEYTVKALPEIVKKARHDAIRSIAKEVSIPGFRKGRAPSYLIVKNYPEPLEKRCKEKVAAYAFEECQKVSTIPLLNHDSKVEVSVVEQSEDGDAKITYSFETEPDVPSIDLEKITLEREEKELVDAKKVDQSIEDIRLYFADWERPRSRIVEEGDYVLIDLSLTEKDPPQKVFEEDRFLFTRETMSKWMFDTLTGMKVGDIKQTVSIPDEETSEKLKEQIPPKGVELTLLSIEKPLLPPIDDVLAKRVGVKTVEEMRQNLEKILNRQAEERRDASYRAQIVDHLLENYSFNLPKSALTKEVVSRLEQATSHPEMRKLLDNSNPKVREKFVQRIKDQSERALRFFYLAERLVKDQKIPISPKEVHQNNATPLETFLYGSSGFDSARTIRQERRDIAISDLILRKTEDFLISKAKLESKKKKEENGESKQSPQKESPDKDQTEEKKEC